MVYQIYPRSFYDANGDGVGDLPGIIEKLDYLSHLGVDALWLSPVNTSPMHDFGYDICDYRGIDPIFGTLDDFDRLIAEAHRRSIRIVMDMVLNHTSYLHPWFIESGSSRDNPKRDWYLWHDGRAGRPPNNWRSAFWGCAWEWHELTGQFYLHSFLKEQPDVNWRSPGLREAMYGDLRFWLDRGVDGFRLDVVNWFIKDRHFRNNPRAFNPFSQRVEKYSRNRPEVHEVMRELRGVTDRYSSRMLVGEVFTYPPGDPRLSASFLGDGSDELHLAFDFSLLYRWWNARHYFRCIQRWYDALPQGAWPCFVLSNHDQQRSFNRYGSSADDDRRARITAVLLLTLRGTPFIYYGEEIGMKNFRIPRDRIADPAGKRFWPVYLGRDCARTPMQWSGENNAGFSSGPLWLPVAMDYPTVNVERQRHDRHSLHSLYRSLIALRASRRALSHGDWRPLNRGHRGIIAYLREEGSQILCVVLNFSAENRQWHIGGHRGQWKVALSTHRSPREHFVSLRMRLYPFEATILERLGDLGI